MFLKPDGFDFAAVIGYHQQTRQAFET